MKRKQLGRSSLHVSEIGFGCMSLTNDQHENEGILHRAIDRGVNFFDTADLYEFGMNEISVGKALKEKRKDIILATKGGNEWSEGEEGWRWNPSKKYIKEAVKGSLKRLETDYIDLYQLHGGTLEDPIDETISAFDELVEEGVIRYYGISSIRPNVIKRYLQDANIVSIMMQYSLFDRRPEELFPLIEEKSVSLIARGPVAKGLLTEKYASKLKADGYLNYRGEELEQTISHLNELAKENSMSLQQLALRYVLASPAVATVIPGARNMEQLLDNLTVAKANELTPSMVEKLKNITKMTKYTSHRD